MDYINKKAGDIYNELPTLFQACYRAAKAEINGADLQRALRLAGEVEVKLRRQLAGRDRYIADLAAAVASKDQLIATLRATNAALEEDRQIQKSHELRAELTETADLLAEARTTLRVKEAHIDGLEHAAREASEAVRRSMALEKIRENLVTRLAEARENICQWKQTAEATQRVLGARQNEMDALLGRNQALGFRAAEYASRLSDCEGRIAELGAELDEVSNLLADANGQCRQTQRALDDVRELNSNQAETIRKYQEAFAHLGPLKTALSHICIKSLETA